MRCLVSILLVVMAWGGRAQEQDVLAIEYPPFTSALLPGGGLAFDVLNTRFSGHGVRWRPEIVPPARAHKRILEGDWCASFYPAGHATDVQVVALSGETIRVGLLRKKASAPFQWGTLSDLPGKTVALLRTGADSPFLAPFIDADKEVAFVDSVHSGVQLVMKGRVDYALFDNVSFDALDSAAKAQLEFSETALLETKISIFFNNKCDIPQSILEPSAP